MTSLRGFFLLVFAIGCGGQLVTDLDASPNPGGDGSVPPGSDGSVTKRDGSIPPSSDAMPPTPCGPHAGSGTVSPSGACTTNEGWSCGPHQYTVTCKCPDSLCTCDDTAGNTTQSHIAKYPGCPSCTTNTSLATLCGFPP